MEPGRLYLPAGIPDLWRAGLLYRSFRQPPAAAAFEIPAGRGDADGFAGAGGCAAGGYSGVLHPAVRTQQACSPLGRNG